MTFVITKKINRGTQIGQIHYATQAEATARMNEMKAKGHKGLKVEQFKA